MSISDMTNSKVTPFLLILFGFIVLGVTEQEFIAGACFVIGITMICNWFWPDKNNVINE